MFQSLLQSYFSLGALYLPFSVLIKSFGRVFQLTITRWRESLGGLVFQRRRTKVIGRRQSKLDEAKKALPRLINVQYDVSDGEQRQELFRFCLAHYPNLNVLINNAGIQRIIDYRLGQKDYLGGNSEVAINLEAPLHLTALFVPRLLKQKSSAVINVSSGLGVVPLVDAPLYSATKAALHSFSISLRRQLKGTSVKVFEILPPIVETELYNQ